jgi:hypothetical protein
MLKTLTSRKEIPFDGSLTIRVATPDDEIALVRLAETDSSRIPTGTVLVAEVGGELWAALSLDDGHGVSDPFRPSAEALWMLTERRRQLRPARRRHVYRLPRVRPIGA